MRRRTIATFRALLNEKTKEKEEKQNEEKRRERCTTRGSGLFFIVAPLRDSI
jgi:hypothetical protein